MKHAQFKDPKFGYVCVVSREDNDLDRPYCQDVRISEWIEVEFPPLPQEQIVQGQLAALDAEQRNLVKEHLAELQRIAEARAKLLALTHEART